MALSPRETVHAFRGALGFCSRVPTGRDDTAWVAFQRWPAVLPATGYVVGALLAVPLLVPRLTGSYGISLPPSTVALAFVGGVVAVTGINHLDGLADLGDAVGAHGSPEDRRAVMRDTDVGVGAVLAIGLVMLALWTAAMSLLRLPVLALTVVVTADVGAKLAMALLCALGTPAHDGLGSAVAGDADLRSAPVALVLAGPVAVLAWPLLAPLLASLAGAIATAAIVLVWSHRRLEGISGDVLGATNELARVVSLHVGVIAWTLS